MGPLKRLLGYFLPQERAAGPIKAGRWTERSSCRWGSVSSRALASLPLGQSAIHGLSQSSQQKRRVSVNEINAPVATVEPARAIIRWPTRATEFQIARAAKCGRKDTVSNLLNYAKLAASIC